MSEGDCSVTNSSCDPVGLAEADGMLVKALLATQISDLVKAKGLRQAAAAELVRMPQPKLSGMLRGQFRGISEVKMMQCLADLGTDVQIVIRAAPAGAEVGKVNVVVQRSVARLKATKPISAVAIQPKQRSSRISSPLAIKA